MTDLECIYYNLTVLAGGWASDEMQGLIAKTILRLPVELRESVPDDVIFICADGMYGQYEHYPMPIFKKEIFHFIILSLSSIEEEEEKYFVIAHEIAHFVLGHYRGNMLEDQDIESEADGLCEKWGFIIPERRKEAMKLK